MPEQQFGKMTIQEMYEWCKTAVEAGIGGMKIQGYTSDKYWDLWYIEAMDGWCVVHLLPEGKAFDPNE